ncbi:MAG: ATPase, T2SS/T4P/T4SS family [Candidatus Absconditabacteria bacterium]|nr:ATPase, T2SS/T4P/T4SS family [Candidatus Absconditabacteria bacterium]
MEQIIGNSILDQYFDEHTMSLHLKENSKIVQKKGSPGNRQPVVNEKIISKQEITNLIDTIYQEITQRDDGFLEIDRKLSKVAQVGPYRIVIVYPPLSDGLEMTVVKPIVRLSIEDYKLSPETFDLLKNKAKGILVSGAPGSGKTTFAQAIIDVYNKENKIIKTIESPRDLQLPENIVQYSFTYGTHDEVRDILLLSRPDYTVYDEVRNKSDFDLYKDLRLTGIGLVGVIHATRPVDSIQRFLGTIEMGIIPQVIDTVVYIEKGEIQEIYTLSLTVKVPEGMMSEELARPVIVITSFLTKNIEYEIYTFGEQIVVMPVGDNHEGGGASPHPARASRQNTVSEYAKQAIIQKLNKHISCDFFTKVKGTSIDLYIPEGYKGRIIGKGGTAINDLEKNIGLKINVKSFEDLPILDEQVDIMEAKGHLDIAFPQQFSNKTVQILVGDEIIKLETDANGISSIKNKPLIKSIQKRGFIVIDESKI